MRFSSNKTYLLLSNTCYEILLLALLFHLYGSIFFTDLLFYGKYIRVANTIFLYFAATNSFFHSRDKINRAVGIIIVVTLCSNLFLLLFDKYSLAKEIRDISYLIFLALNFYYILVFIISPHRLDNALISAAAAGYLLIIEVATRFFLILYRHNGNNTLSNIDFTFHTKTFIDTVYYCTVSITSIGFGDILPLSHNAKMVTSLLGLVGQFYLVVIMGIMVSKFISKQK